LPILFAESNRLYEPLTLLVEQRRCLSLQQLRVPDHVAKWRPQVVGDGIGKRFQFLVGRFEFHSPCAEFLIEFANFVLSVPALFHLELKVVAGLTKAVLDSASNSAERGDNCRPCDENEIVRQICTGNVEGVKGLRKEVVEAGRGQQNGQHGGPGSCIPGGEGDGQSKNRQFHVAKLVMLNCERHPKRDRDGND
jgi:hypothetical protein